MIMIIIEELLMKPTKRLTILFSLLCFTLYGAETKPKKPLLIYNQFPRVWDMNFQEMSKHLQNIKDMGFNIIWVNPFFKTSEKVVTRIDEFTGETIRVKGSLYAMSTKDEYCQGVNEEDIKKYAQQAKNEGLSLIFDLVTNHVDKDSKYYEDNKTLFEDNNKKWDDIIPFDYSTQYNKTKIFKDFWNPLINKMIELGFDGGVRIDYATGINPDILKQCIGYLKEQTTNPIIFGESLIPHSLLHTLPKYKDVGFINLTNAALFLSKEKINRKEGFVNHDLGLKRLILHQSDVWRHGTIGFPGSHDNGTILQAAVKESLTKKVIEDNLKSSYPISTALNQLTQALKSNPMNYKAWDDYKKNIQNAEKKTAGQLVQKRLSSVIDKEFWAKERIAIAAFCSDAGWYLMAGDEVLSEVSKSPFIRADDKPFAINQQNDIRDINNFSITNQIPNFIKKVNTIFLKLKDPEDLFWCDVFYIGQNNDDLCFVRHYKIKETEDIDVIVVDLSKDDNSMFKYSIEQIQQEYKNRYCDKEPLSGATFFYLKGNTIIDKDNGELKQADNGYYYFEQKSKTK